MGSATVDITELERLCAAWAEDDHQQRMFVAQRWGQMMPSLLAELRRLRSQESAGLALQLAHRLLEKANGVDAATVRIDLLEQCVAARMRETIGGNHERGRVYFIRSGPDGPVKIGFSLSPQTRLVSLQTASPSQLRLLKSFPGDEARERQLHEHFAALRMEGEWFRPEERLLTFIKELFE